MIVNAAVVFLAVIMILAGLVRKIVIGKKNR